MRLAFVGPVHPFRGGIAHFTARLATEVSLTDDCFIVNFTHLYPDAIFPGKTQFDSSRSEFSFPSERILDPLNPFSWRRASRKIASWNPDAIIFHHWHPFFIPAFQSIAKSFAGKIPSIAICHNIAPHEGSLLQKNVTRSFFKNINGFMIHAQSEAADLLHIMPNAVWTAGFHPLYDIFPGQDISREEARRILDIGSRTKLALYFGLIRPYKGVDLFFEACMHLNDLPDLKMLAVGEIYSNEKELTDLVSSIPNGRAELRNRYVPNEEVSLYFRAADLIVLPYRSATQSGIVPIAYACDRPVVVTNVGGLPEVVIDGVTGYIVPPNNSTALARAIKDYFDSDDKNRFSTGIAEMRQRLSWARYAKLLRDLVIQITRS